MLVLTSLKNPWIKEIRKLHQAKYRRSQQQFLLEGTHLLQEAIATQYPLLSACATPRWQERHPTVWEQIKICTERQETVTPEVMSAIATTASPEGIIAIAPQQQLWTPSTNQPPQLGVALEALQDPGNLGTVIRTAAAAGSDGLWLNDSSVDLVHPKVLRASAGQWFRLPKQRISELRSNILTWKSMGCQVLATALEGTVPYWEIDFNPPTVLVFGNEGAGLSKEVLDVASQVISIPMVGAVESLNVGIAAAIILFEALRQRQYLH